MPSIFPYPKISLTVKDYLTSLILNRVSIFSPNAATGSTSATLNKKSGTVTFTAVISGTTMQAFTINNSFITATSGIVVGLNYNPLANSGKPRILSYIKNTGVLTLYVDNPPAAATNADIVIDLIITS